MSAKLVILLSGSGSNLQAFIDAVNANELPAEIALVISNRPNAYGLKRAAKANIPTATIDHTLFDDRESFDAELIRHIDGLNPDLIILAGFMRILTTGFVQHFRGRLLNIHPSLLPKYPGLNTHQRAIDAGDNKAGATVHFVTEELDGGPAIVQAKVPIIKGDNAEALAGKTLVKEHKIYPLAAKWFIEGSLQLKDKATFLNDKPLPVTGAIFDE
jgi:phosphoribosylglycinamide formyltransferase-1